MSKKERMTLGKAGRRENKRGVLTGKDEKGQGAMDGRGDTNGYNFHIIPLISRHCLSSLEFTREMFPEDKKKKRSRPWSNTRRPVRCRKETEIHTEGESLAKDPSRGEDRKEVSGRKMVLPDSLMAPRHDNFVWSQDSFSVNPRIHQQQSNEHTLTAHKRTDDLERY